MTSFVGLQRTQNDPLKNLEGVKRVRTLVGLDNAFCSLLGFNCSQLYAKPQKMFWVGFHSKWHLLSNKGFFYHNIQT